MTETANLSLYEKVVRVTNGYLGPAADRFVSRQISTHLGKEPHRLHGRDLHKLIDWISLSMAVLVEDQELIKQYIDELKELAA